MENDPATLAAGLARLEARMAALEAAGGASAPEAAGAGSSANMECAPGPAIRDERFWLLERLAANTGPAFARDGVAGSLAYGGRVRAPGAGEVVWQLEHAAPDVLDADLDAAAAVLAALGHPSRLRILRHLLRGARTLGDLQEALPDAGTSGQLHHHLRELRAAGLVVSRRRNDYAVPAERVVPVLVMLAAALGDAT